MIKNFINKKIFLLSIMILNTLISSNTIHASKESIQSTVDYSNIFNEQIKPNSYDDVRWYYRIVNGREQRRLWSFTAGEWLTDWEFI